VSGFLFKLLDTALFPQPEFISSYHNLTMATFTSIPQATSSQFRHYDPMLLKRTKSKAEAKVTGHTLCIDRTERANYNFQGTVFALTMQAN
jgi:hypothetical protein